MPSASRRFLRQTSGSVCTTQCLASSKPTHTDEKPALLRRLASSSARLACVATDSASAAAAAGTAAGAATATATGMALALAAAGCADPKVEVVTGNLRVPRFRLRLSKLSVRAIPACQAC